MLIIGVLVFLPGFYHLRIAFYASKGYRGYSYDDIPDFDDWSWPVPCRSYTSCMTLFVVFYFLCPSRGPGWGHVSSCAVYQLCKNILISKIYSDMQNSQKKRLCMFVLRMMWRVHRYKKILFQINDFFFFFFTISLWFKKNKFIVWLALSRSLVLITCIAPTTFYTDECKSLCPPRVRKRETVPLLSNWSKNYSVKNKMLNKNVTQNHQKKRFLYSYIVIWWIRKEMMGRGCYHLNME